MSYVYNIVTPLRELTCHVGSHSATCQMTELTFPPLPQPKLILDLATKGACQDLHAVHILDRLNVIRKEASRDATAGYHYFSNLLLLLLLLLSIAGLPRSTIAPSQRVQNAAARLVARLGPRDHDSERPPLATRRTANRIQVMSADASTQLNSTENYGRRCLTPLTPHHNYILS